MSDYTLLEETDRAIQSAARIRQSVLPAHNPIIANPRHAPSISKGRMNMLAREAAKRNIRLRFMPRGMGRHSRNSSYVRSLPESEIEAVEKNTRREKAMFWHLDVYFASCSEKAPGTKLVKVDACDEVQTVCAILRGAIGAMKKGRKRRRGDTITCSASAKDGYGRYLDAALKELVVFLRNEHVVSAGVGSPSTVGKNVSRKDDFDIRRYLPVDNEQTLRQVLDGRNIVEFPVLHVAFRGSKEAKDLSVATTGIFEKPDDSDDSDSSESDSDEQEDESASAAALPVSPVAESKEIDLGKDGIPSGNDSIEEFPEKRIEGDEPVFKRRKIEVPVMAEAPPPADGINTAEKNDTENCEKPVPDVKSIGAASQGLSDPKPVDTSEAQGVKNTKPRSIQEDDKKMMEIGPVTQNGGNKGLVTGSKPSGNEVSVVPKEKEVSVDTVARRGSGLHLDHPFMKESVKAILETRIPRKPKADPKGSVPSSSSKGSAKLTATG